MAEPQTIDNGFWDIADLSGYLKVKIKTLYAMSHDIPHYRVGRLIRFRKPEIDAWLENKRASRSSNGAPIKGNRHNRDHYGRHEQIDGMVKKVIDQAKLEHYNLGHGKSDRIEGLGKEAKSGSI